MPACGARTLVPAGRCVPSERSIGFRTFRMKDANQELDLPRYQREETLTDVSMKPLDLAHETVELL